VQLSAVPASGCFPFSYPQFHSHPCQRICN